LVKGEAFLYELLRHLPAESFKFILIGRDREKDARFLKQQGFDAIRRPQGSYGEFIKSYRDIDALLILSVAPIQRQPIFSPGLILSNAMKPKF